MAHILFALSDPETAAFAVDHFRREHHRVTVVYDGAAAEAAIEADSPDVLVTSMMLRGTDGFALRTLARRHLGSKCSCLLLTGLGSDGTPIRGWDGYFEAYCISREPWQMVLSIEQLLAFDLIPKQVPLP